MLDTVLQCGIVVIEVIMIFIESSSFTKSVYKYLSDEEYKNFQALLTENPQLGDPIPGCGGIRKVRWTQERKSQGKRGGVRIIYLYIEYHRHIHLLAIFGKREKEDLSSQEKETLKKLSIQLKKSAKERRII